MVVNAVSKLNVYLDHLLKDIDLRAQQKLEQKFQNKKVLIGPFSGLKYPEFTSVHSKLFPKLLGSYEFCLHEIFNSYDSNEFNSIVDIGCAEGYYAVGLAKIFPKASILAIDINPAARTQCEEMAKHNDVSGRLTIRSNFDIESDKDFLLNGKSLVVCDCEGFEYELFDIKNIPFFSNCDLIIELHDFINPDISSRIKENFANSHNVKIIDEKMMPTSNLDFMKGMNSREKEMLTNEERPVKMQWAHVTIKS